MAPQTQGQTPRCRRISHAAQHSAVVRQVQQPGPVLSDDVARAALYASPGSWVPNASLRSRETPLTPIWSPGRDLLTHPDPAENHFPPIVKIVFATHAPY